MGEFIENTKREANEAVGKAKVAVGKTMDRPSMIADGVAQQIKSKVQKTKGAVKDKLGDKF